MSKRRNPPQGGSVTKPAPREEAHAMPDDAPRFDGAERAALLAEAERREADAQAAQPRGPVAAFAALREAAGGAWDGVDADEYVRGMRGEGPPRFEYLKVWIRDDQWEDQANELGHDGWELVWAGPRSEPARPAAGADPVQYRGHDCFFKRGAAPGARLLLQAEGGR